MKTKNLNVLVVVACLIFSACSKSTTSSATSKSELKTTEQKTVKKTHQFGGWYCPDNLYGFPAVNVQDWATVPVIENRLPTEEEAKSESSLIYIDNTEYPEAKALPVGLPKLARFYNEHTKRNELVIVIQAIEVLGDSIVGFRYVNGGNGSSYLHEVNFLSQKEVNAIKPGRFVTLEIAIEAKPDAVWNVLTEPTFKRRLAAIYSPSKKETYVRNTSNVNYEYMDVSALKAEFAGDMYGAKYIQNDYEHNDYQFTEKFFVKFEAFTNQSTLKLTCGPYGNDYNEQKEILEKWIKTVKTLSEKQKE